MALILHIKGIGRGIERRERERRKRRLADCGGVYFDEKGKREAMLTRRDLDEMFGGWLSMSRDSVEGDLARRRLHVAG